MILNFAAVMEVSKVEDLAPFKCKESLESFEFNFRVFCCRFVSYCTPPWEKIKLNMGPHHPNWNSPAIKSGSKTFN